MHKRWSPDPDAIVMLSAMVAVPAASFMTWWAVPWPPEKGWDFLGAIMLSLGMMSVLAGALGWWAIHRPLERRADRKANLTSLVDPCYSEVTRRQLEDLMVADPNIRFITARTVSGKELTVFRGQHPTSAEGLVVTQSAGSVRAHPATEVG